MKCKQIISLTLMCLLLSSCGAKEQDDSFLGISPDPEEFFEDSECSKYEVESLCLKGVTVKYDDENLKEAYDDYIESCEETGVWSHPVFDGDTSWCYQNEDKTLQIAINLNEDDHEIDISVKALTKED